MILAEILGGKEDVVVAGGVEPIADGGPKIARHERVDEAQLREGARRFDERNELVNGVDRFAVLGVAADRVFLTLRRGIARRREVDGLPARLQIRKPLGVDDQPCGRVEGRWRVDDRAVDEFSVVLIHTLPFIFAAFERGGFTLGRGSFATERGSFTTERGG